NTRPPKRHHSGRLSAPGRVWAVAGWAGSSLLTIWPPSRSVWIDERSREGVPFRSGEHWNGRKQGLRDSSQTHRCHIFSGGLKGPKPCIHLRQSQHRPRSIPLLSRATGHEFAIGWDLETQTNSSRISISNISPRPVHLVLQK